MMNSFKKALIILLFSAISFFAVAQQPCPDIGSATTVKKQLANQLKNREIISQPVNPYITLSQLLMGGEDSRRFTENDFVSLTGYLVEVREGGVESCNCAAEVDSLQDIHLYIGTTPHALKSECVIAEVTPKWKRLNRHVDIKDMKGKIVVVSGFLFFDAEHKGNAVNTCKKCTRVWRKTCWEVHPIVKIEVKQ